MHQRKETWIPKLLSTNEIHALVLKAINHLNNIGWDHFILLRISCKWKDDKAGYQKRFPSKRPLWASHSIKILWNDPEKVWKTENKKKL